MYNVSPLLTSKTNTGDPCLCLVSTTQPNTEGATIRHITRQASDVLMCPPRGDYSGDTDTKAHRYRVFTDIHRHMQTEVQTHIKTHIHT